MSRVLMVNDGAIDAVAAGGHGLSVQLLELPFSLGNDDSTQMGHLAAFPFSCLVEMKKLSADETALLCRWIAPLLPPLAAWPTPSAATPR